MKDENDGKNVESVVRLLLNSSDSENVPTAIVDYQPGMLTALPITPVMTNS
jgi:hypothetical protein